MFGGIDSAIYVYNLDKPSVYDTEYADIINSYNEYSLFNYALRTMRMTSFFVQYDYTYIDSNDINTSSEVFAKIAFTDSNEDPDLKTSIYFVSINL